MISFRLSENSDLGTKWKLLAVAIGGAAGKLGSYLGLTS